MPKIIISGEAMDAMRQDSKLHIKDCTPMSRGQWRVPVSDEVLGSLRKVTLRGESLSDAIVRLIAKRRGLN